MPAADLLTLVEALRAPFGFERSMKLVDGAVYDDRYLVSLHRRAFGADGARAVTEMAARLGAPEAVLGAVAERLQGADVVHFGHEAERGAVTRKLYFEYAASARAAMARRAPALVHLAYKWRPDGATALTRYTWRPCASRAEAEARIAARLPERSAPRARAAVLALLDRASGLARGGGLDMLDVEEPGLPRISLDVNVYDADLKVGDVAALIAETGAAFGIADERMTAALGPARPSTLGHLAAGLDRREREFVTVYFGVEARGP